MRDSGDPTRYVIVEVWESVEALQAAATRVPAEKMGGVQVSGRERSEGRVLQSNRASALGVAFDGQLLRAGR